MSLPSELQTTTSRTAPPVRGRGQALRRLGAAANAVVVVVDDDPRTRAPRALALARGGDFAVVALGLAEVAALDDARLAAIVVSYAGAKQGVQLASGLARLNCIAVIAAKGVGASLRNLLAKETPLMTLESLDDVEAVCSAVNDRLGASATVECPFSLIEYVQLAGLGGHAVGLRCYHCTGEFAGEVVIASGIVRSATFGALRGFPAFAALITRPNLQVGFASADGAPEDPDLGGNWQSLVLEALRVADERAAGSEAQAAPQESPDEASFQGLLERPPPPADVGEGSPPISSGKVARIRRTLQPVAGDQDDSRRLVEDGVRAIIAGDYSRAVALLERASELYPNDRAVRHQLKRLKAIRSEGRDL